MNYCDVFASIAVCRQLRPSLQPLPNLVGSVHWAYSSEIAIYKRDVLDFSRYKYVNSNDMQNKL